MESEKDGLGIALSVLVGIGLFVTVKQTVKLSKKIYRRLRPAK